MEQEMENLLLVVANPTRRAILEHLAREPHYALQLAKRIGVSQQAIMKHLAVLEAAAIVGSTEVPSQEGPPRRYYALKRRFSIRIDVRPDYFDSRVMVVEHEPGGDETLLNEFWRSRSERDLERRAERLSAILGTIDERLSALEEGYDRLVALKEEVQRELHRIIAELYSDYRHREILYCLVESHATCLDDVSEMLDLRKKAVQELLEGMSAHHRLVDALLTALPLERM